jgi:hypothetical protein
MINIVQGPRYIHFKLHSLSTSLCSIQFLKLDTILKENNYGNIVSTGT